MERIMCINSFINSRNRILFRFPIYREFRSGERYINTVKNYTSVTRQTLFLNHINCRQKSSAIDGNIHSLQIKAATRVKTRKFRMVKTNVTQVTHSSSSQVQQPMKLVTGGSLPRFINESIPNKKLNQDPSLFRLNEEPLLHIPEKFKMKSTENDSEWLEKFRSSFENFLRLNPLQEAVVEEETIEKVESMPETDTELQKDYESIDQTDFFKRKSLNQNLKCYINACISSNLTERAFVALMTARKYNSVRKYKFNLDDPELYSDLMAKYSTLQNWTRVKHIFNILIAEKISITPQVYMNILDCLGRMKDSKENSSRIIEFIQKAEDQGISLNDIMDKSTFIKDQRTFVMKAIRKVRLSFSPDYTAPQLGYSNKLLDSLNEGINSIEVKPSQMLHFEKEYPISRPKSGFTAEELNAYAAEQIKNECEGHINVKNVTMLDPSKYLNEHVKLQREIVDKLTNQWRVEIANAIRKKLSILQHKMNTKSIKTMNIFPYMRLLTPEQYTEILIDELKTLASSCELYSPTVVEIYGNLGQKVMHKYQIKYREQTGVNAKIRNLHKMYREILCSGTCPDNPRQLWQRIIHHSRKIGPCIFQKHIDWPWGVRCDVGRTLFKILLENIKIDTNLLDPNSSQTNYAPVVYSIFRKRDLMSREEIRPHPIFAQLMRESKQDVIKFKTNEVPMLCPPMPWTSAESGGYLHSQTILLRLPSQYTYQNDLVRQVPPEQLYPPLDACNQLGTIPWRVNTKILDLAIKIFNLGGNEKLDVPLTPDDMLTDEQLKYRGVTRAQLETKKSVYDEKYRQRQNELFSMYSDTLYKLSLAHHFRDRAFWLPTNMDFRGRSYPVPPHLTHLSADLTRSMLCFYQKQPLGESGLDWLKLHCINLTGLKKRESIQDRLTYANEIIDDILDSAENPLDGRQWWLKSDDPWQTLAACMEIADAMRSPNPAEFMSGFPIHQDGSCNGLQHYAALGRDVDGAASVNLAPSHVPQDVYSTIANRVEELRKIDAKNGVQVAIDLKGLIKRKIVKQTVMTTVYGVTAYGARLQIKKQLKNIDFPSDSIVQASNYLTRKTFDSLSEMFSSAREIQDWLTDSARYISSKNRSKHVEWTTPLGLPVIQPYTRNHKVSLQSNATIKTLHNEKGVNRVKEKNAFSPNFIHSLDSCHMMLTSLNCEKVGTTFVSVHDCFWTHPSTVPIMNRICREQFILLHSQPILEDLAESFYQKYEIEFRDKHPQVNELQIKKKKKKSTIVTATTDTLDLGSVPKSQHTFMKLPKKGDFDLNSVLDSVYFFS